MIYIPAIDCSPEYELSESSPPDTKTSEPAKLQRWATWSLEAQQINGEKPVIRNV